jgi:hypothetical protein
MSVSAAVASDAEPLPHSPSDDVVTEVVQIAEQSPEVFRDLAKAYHPQLVGRKVSTNDWARMAQLCNLAAATGDRGLIKMLLIKSNLISEGTGHPVHGYLKTKHPHVLDPKNWKVATQTELDDLIANYKTYTGQ